MIVETTAMRLTVAHINVRWVSGTVPTVAFAFVQRKSVTMLRTV